METILRSQDHVLYHTRVPTDVDPDYQEYYDDGYEITNNSIVVAGYTVRFFHEDIDYHIMQFIDVSGYMEEPTYENAVKLVEAQGFHVPLSALVQVVKASIRANAPKVSRGRGGADDEASFETVAKPRKKLTKKKLDSVIALDTMKDIHPTSTPALWDMVRIPETDQESLNKAKDAASFHKVSAKIIKDLLGVSMNMYKLPLKKKDKDYLIQSDATLYQQILQWTTIDTLTFVFDGLLNDVNLSSFIRRIFLMAVVQLILTNLTILQEYSEKLDVTNTVFLPSLPKKIKYVKLLDGPFQTNDKVTLAPTLQKYLNEINFSTKALSVEIIKIHDGPQYFTKYYEEDPTGNQWQQTTPIPNKKQLQQRFHKEPPAVQKDLAIRNFVRDAWKADVAIQHNAIFISSDKNALAYHKWVCEKEGIQRHALGVLIPDSAFVYAPRNPT